MRACVVACFACLPLTTLLALGIAVMLPAAPLFRSVPGRDSGVFLYVASRILDGEMPYRKVWDHKPPAIYYLDALGLALGGRSMWGVWILQVLFVCSAIALGFLLLRKALGVVPALFGSVAWISTLGILLIWDNYPEEFALPLQFASVYLFCAAERSQHRSLWEVIIGVLGAACFLLKPTLLGTHLAIVLVLILRHAVSNRARLASDLAAISAGVLLVLAPITAYFWAEGALGEGLDAVFRYGLLYSTAPIEDRLLAILSGLGGLPALSGAPAVALVSWVSICRRAVRGRNRRAIANDPNPISGNDDRMRASKLLSSLVLVWLPIELLLVVLPGRSYGYYYTAWLPVFGILCALFAHDLISALQRRSERWQLACLCVFLPVMVAVPAITIFDRVSMVTSTASTRIDATSYIAAHTSEGDSVLIWGAEPGVNFAARRRSPTRFAYQYALLTRGYGDYADGFLVREFLSDLRSDMPALIIDASASDRITPPLDLFARGRWVPKLVYYVPPAMQEVFDYISSHYRFVGRLGRDGWQLYARKLCRCAGEVEIAVALSRALRDGERLSIPQELFSHDLEPRGGRQFE